VSGQERGDNERAKNEELKATRQLAAANVHQRRVLESRREEGKKAVGQILHFFKEDWKRRGKLKVIK